MLLSLEGAAPPDATGVLVEALDVLLPPRASVAVLAQVAAADEKRGGGGNGGGGNGGGGNGGGDEPAAAATAAGERPHVPIGHIALAQLTEAATPQHAHAVRLIWLPPAAPRLAALRLEPHELSFGSVRIGGAEEPPSLSFTIFNERASEVNFMLMLRKEEPSGASDKKSAEASKDGARDPADPAAPKAARPPSLVPLLLHPRNGFIPPGGSCVVEVRCVAPQPGSHIYVVVVRNLSGAGSAQDLLLHIRARGVHPQHLWFPDLEGDPSKHVLSFGLCYPPPGGWGAVAATAAHPPGAAAAAAAPRRYVRKLPFRIANSQREPRHLCVTSNLAKQASILRDPNPIPP